MTSTSLDSRRIVLSLAISQFNCQTSVWLQSTFVKIHTLSIIFSHQGSASFNFFIWQSSELNELSPIFASGCFLFWLSSYASSRSELAVFSDGEWGSVLEQVAVLMLRAIFCLSNESTPMWQSENVKREGWHCLHTVIPVSPRPLPSSNTCLNESKRPTCHVLTWIQIWSSYSTYWK